MDIMYSAPSPNNLCNSPGPNAEVMCDLNPPPPGVPSDHPNYWLVSILGNYDPSLMGEVEVYRNKY